MFGGYYTSVHVLMLMGFMALCRIKTVEQLRAEAPGEFGKLLGLDRIPEVRCLRRKLSELGKDEAADRWAAHLSQKWMQADPEAAGTLYVDGHVRVYHGSKSALPRRYVSRQRLCLRGISDYWVNDAIGQPFFVVEKPVDPGLLETLRTGIVPRLLREVPNQPSEEELQANPQRSRFTLVFDREGYSPGFFAEMWRTHRIGCITYHKHPRGQWPGEWFQSREVIMPGGESVSMALAEMGSLVGSGKQASWMREVRKLTESGHQVSLISTAFNVTGTELAARLFTRWCQSKFREVRKSESRLASYAWSCCRDGECWSGKAPRPWPRHWLRPAAPRSYSNRRATRQESAGPGMAASSGYRVTRMSPLCHGMNFVAKMSRTFITPSH